MEERLRIDERETSPVLPLFRDAGVRIHHVAAVAACDKTAERIARLVNKA